MKEYVKMTAGELKAEKNELSKIFGEYKNKNLKLDMSRGKPGADQLDISEGILKAVSSNGEAFAGSTDTRNYGGIDGLPDMKKLFSELLEVSPDEIIVGGNSSLNMMFDTVSRAMTHGIMGNTPWSKLPKVKFLCPVPGYDRHFGICQSFGIEMINVPMKNDGPDMDMVEKLVSGDEAVKGIWCVPKYSNPQGITYGDETVRRFARLKAAARDFRIFWDNAYFVHDLTDTPDRLLNILSECRAAGNSDICYIFASTSKITYPGGGVAAMAASVANINAAKEIIKYQTIGPDKINQLRHVRYFKNAEGVRAHMKKHARFIKPKFDTILNALETQVKPLGIAQWVAPNGGYFISLEVMPGCASAVHALLSELGVTMTGAGATYPYGKDPFDSNLRIAPTYLSEDELKTAVDMLCLCVRLAAVNKLLEGE